MAMPEIIGMGLQIASKIIRELFYNTDSDQNAAESIRDLEWDVDNAEESSSEKWDDEALFIVFIAAVIIFACCLCLLNL